MRVFLAFLAFLAAAVLGCSSKSESAASSSPPADPAATAKANEIFAQRCTPCHGASGRGDGAASASLSPKPRNFHDKVWHKSVDDDHIRKIIQYGGSAVGKSAAMPANPDLQDKPDVISALKDKIRGFGRED